MASDFVRKLGVMTHNVDRSMGHIHPEGNPHVHLNPNNLLEIADMLAERLIIIDQRNLSTYDTNLSTFKQKWSVLINEWNASASMLKGEKVIVYHKSWSYLLDWLGVDILTTLEPKPGLPPTSAHLETVLQTVKGQDVLGILVAPFENDKAAIWLSEKSDIPILHLPYTVGGDEQVTDLESLFTQSIKLLKEGSI
jgi:zinc/manganese transport system substrate-binding protein